MLKRESRLGHKQAMGSAEVVVLGEGGVWVVTTSRMNEVNTTLGKGEYRVADFNLAQFF